MRRNSSILAAALLAVLTACGPVAASAGGTGATSVPTGTVVAATASTTPTTPVPWCVPGQVGPLGASFVSGDDGFLLAITLPGCKAGVSSRVVLRRTTDGGLRWAALPAPPMPWGSVVSGNGKVPAGGVTAVLFANAKDGWAYGPGLWATHDGGLTWHQVATPHGYAVTSLAATNGRVIASLENCDPEEGNCSGAMSAAIETSQVGGGAWRRIPGATAGTEVTAAGGTGYALPVGPPVGLPPGSGAAGTDWLLTGPADGSARWLSRPLPCQPGAIALSAVTASHLILSCSLLGRHPEATAVYTSTDGGKHWTRVGTTFGMFDGASTVERTASGTILAAGIYDGAVISRNGGRAWTRPTAIDGAFVTGGGAPVLADLVTNSDGYAIVSWYALWITRDGGKTWQQVTVR